MDNGIYQVKVDDIFEGPMDLLVHLIKKNEVDIYDIPIALITEQYLAYLDLLKSLNIDLAGEFLVMAATLTHIKSRLLLPAAGGDGDDDDPRMELVRPLEEYLQLKSAAEELARRELLGEATFVRGPGNIREWMEPDDEVVKIGLFELIDAFQKILQNIAPEERLDLTAERISVKDRISQLVDLFQEKNSLTFDELFAENSDIEDLIVTFLAILEMVKVNLIRLVQHTQSGVIRLFYE